MNIIFSCDIFTLRLTEQRFFPTLSLRIYLSFNSVNIYYLLPIVPSVMQLIRLLSLDTETKKLIN